MFGTIKHLLVKYQEGTVHKYVCSSCISVEHYFKNYNPKYKDKLHKAFRDSECVKNAKFFFYDFIEINTSIIKVNNSGKHSW